MAKRRREDEEEDGQRKKENFNDLFALNIRQPMIPIPNKKYPNNTEMLKYLESNAADILTGSLYKKNKSGKDVGVAKILEISMAFTMRLELMKSLDIDGDAPNIFDLLNLYNNHPEDRKRSKDVHGLISVNVLNAILEHVTPELIKKLFRFKKNEHEFNSIIKSNTKIAFYLYNYIKIWPIVSKTETTLYSGIGASFNFRSIQQIVHGNVNDEITIKKFVSMTPQIEIAREFARVLRNLHIMQITLDPGCPIVAIPPRYTDLEFLLNMGAIVKITRTPSIITQPRFDGDYTITTYYITVIGFEDYDTDYFGMLIRSANFIWNTDIEPLESLMRKERGEQTAQTLKARGEQTAPTLNIEEKELSDYELDSDHTQSGGSRKRRKSKKHPSRYNYRKRKSFTKKKTHKKLQNIYFSPRFRK